MKSGRVFFDQQRFNFCDDCQHKKKRDKFRSNFESSLKARLQPGKIYRFDEMLNLLHVVRVAQDAESSETSVKTAALLSVYLQSKNTYDREQEARKDKTKT